eukprot:ANDGO_06152.mRNA.1 Formimidoylglutamase
MSVYSDDVRLGEVISPGMEGDIVLIGFARDAGVIRNNGRPGAANGPAAFRRMLGRTGTIVNPEWNLDLRSPNGPTVSDAGDVVGDSLEEAHAHLEQMVTQIVRRGGIPFIVGGGNDQSYPNAAGVLNVLTERRQSLGVVNIDAHLDVRPLKPVSQLSDAAKATLPPALVHGADGLVAHSGSPFRKLLEDPRFNGTMFAEFACQGSQCSQEHTDYVRSKGGKLYWFGDIQSSAVASFSRAVDAMRSDCVFVSFDIDSIVSASCPGVSAPATYGLTAWDACQMLKNSGEDSRVVAVDMSEFNPLVEEYRTAKLVTQMFYHFVAGVAIRKQRRIANQSTQ